MASALRNSVMPARKGPVRKADGEIIKTLIDSEPSEDVLSDDKLVEMLRKDGIDIARRTVAKYREALRIPSSVQRRRDKAIGVR